METLLPSALNRRNRPPSTTLFTDKRRQHACTDRRTDPIDPSFRSSSSPPSTQRLSRRRAGQSHKSLEKKKRKTSRVVRKEGRKEGRWRRQKKSKEGKRGRVRAGTVEVISAFSHPCTRFISFFFPFQSFLRCW